MNWGMLAGAVIGFVITVIFARQLGIWGGAPVLGGAAVGGIMYPLGRFR